MLSQNWMFFLEFIAMSLSLIGTILIIVKNKNGFICWFIANLIWIYFDVCYVHIWQGLMFIVFSIIAMWGYWYWDKREVEY